MTKPVVLCILDGWGLSDRPDQSAPDQAATPNFDRLMRDCPHATLTTFGPDVGLPRGQMGNSEVGHTNIGAGRVVAMDLGQIDLAIEDGSFVGNESLVRFVERLRATGGTAHLMGVVSDGGVHGHVVHVQAAVRAIAGAGVPVVLHAITDGRDVPPQSAMGFVTELQGSMPAGARIGTVIGRYYAMDRDNRWERVERAYRAIVAGQGEPALSADLAVTDAYARGETDEFIQPFIIDGYNGAMDGDGFFCLNFRADRAREILAAIADPAFDHFDTSDRPEWAALLGMVDYSSRHNEFMTTAYPKRQVTNTLGAWVAAKGLRQFRLAETEKYPHVTFFFSGGRDVELPGETRILIPSPKVATYDLKPEMSAYEVAAAAVKEVNEDKQDVIILNFANPDMVGHSGMLEPTIKAVEATDECLGQVVEAILAKGGVVCITADHGNADLVLDDAERPFTAHTTNPVPFIVTSNDVTLREGGVLADIAPTLLHLLKLPQPPEMTGLSIIEEKK